MTLIIPKRLLKFYVNNHYYLLRIANIVQIQLQLHDGMLYAN